MPSQYTNNSYSVLQPSLLPKLVKASKTCNTIHHLISPYMMPRSTSNCVSNSIDLRRICERGVEIELVGV